MKLYSLKELQTKEIIQSDAIKFTSEMLPELSNFAILPAGEFIVDEFGLEYSSTETYYQACKSLEYDIRKTFTRLSPKDAKRKGKEIFIRDDWEIIKYLIMRNALEQKFKLQPFKDILNATTDLQLIEWTYWNDKIWGMWDVDKTGCNALGKLLQERRMLNRVLSGNSFI